MHGIVSNDALPCLQRANMKSLRRNLNLHLTALCRLNADYGLTSFEAVRCRSLRKYKTLLQPYDSVVEGTEVLVEPRVAEVDGKGGRDHGKQLDL